MKQTGSKEIFLPRPSDVIDFGNKAIREQIIGGLSTGLYEFNIRNEPYWGVMRLENHGNSFTISGDIYRDASLDRRTLAFNFFNHGNIQVTLSQLVIPIKIRRFEQTDFEFIPQNGYIKISTEEAYIDCPYLDSSVSKNFKQPYFRELELICHEINSGDFPYHDGSNIDWNDVFEVASIRVGVRKGMSLPLRDPWSEDELLDELTNVKNYFGNHHSGNWKIHVFCVNDLAIGGKILSGIMFDEKFVKDNFPREGVSIAGNWAFNKQVLTNHGVQPNSYRHINNQVIKNLPKAFFRVAVHEVAHALNLKHGNGIMKITSDLLTSLQSDFPDKIDFTFDNDDLIYLKHASDAYVRPGILPYSNNYTLKFI